MTENLSEGLIWGMGSAVVKSSPKMNRFWGRLYYPDSWSWIACCVSVCVSLFSHICFWGFLDMLVSQHPSCYVSSLGEHLETFLIQSRPSPEAQLQCDTGTKRGLDWVMKRSFGPWTINFRVHLMICHSSDSAVKPVLSFKADPCSHDSVFRGHCPNSGALKFAW